MDADKIKDATGTCLGYALGHATPFSRVASFLASLKNDPNWTDAEIMEVQTQVIRLLMNVLAAVQEGKTGPSGEPRQPS